MRSLIVNASTWSWVTYTIVGRELAMHLDQLELDALSQAAIEGAERLVHQQELRFEHNGSGERYPLLLSSRQLARILVDLIRELDEIQARWTIASMSDRPMRRMRRGNETFR